MAGKQTPDQVDEFDAVQGSLVQLARLSLSGRQQDSSLFLQRLARRFRDSEPRLAEALVAMLREAPTRSSPLRRSTAAPVPVDSDSRLSLVRVEDPPAIDAAPILPPAVHQRLRQLIDERRRSDQLAEVGLAPTRTALLLGPPGVGKTMAARWLAAELGVPFLVLDLSAVMSSLLGRTGVNLRHVLDYAKAQNCVLLVDELDSIGKRRNDDADIGELKRLVNVLLQQLDDWPVVGGLLMGATNHPELLDPALWRRFESTIELPLPDLDARQTAVHRFTNGLVTPEQEAVLARAFGGSSFSDIETAVNRAQRAFALGYGPLEDCLLDVCAEHMDALGAPERRQLAVSLVRDLGVSQRRAHEFTGVSRDTIRKAVRVGEVR